MSHPKTSSSAAPDPSPPASLRLRLKPGAPSTAYVDGGWWPQSKNLPTELPALLSSLAPLIGHIALVGYHLDAWDSAPENVDIGGDDVLLQGFTAHDPHSVVIIATSGQRLTLLVISPDSEDREAQQALSNASEPAVGVGVELDPEHTTDRSLAEVATRISLLEGVTDDAGRARIKRWVSEASHQFIGAPVQSFVSLLIEHIVRGRIATAARAAATPP